MYDTGSGSTSTNFSGIIKASLVERGLFAARIVEVFESRSDNVRCW